MAKTRRFITEEQLLKELNNYTSDTRELYEDLRKFSSGVHLSMSLQPQMQACQKSLHLAIEYLNAAAVLHANQMQLNKAKKQAEAEATNDN